MLGGGADGREASPVRLASASSAIRPRAAGSCIVGCAPSLGGVVGIFCVVF